MPSRACRPFAPPKPRASGPHRRRCRRQGCAGARGSRSAVRRRPWAARAMLCSCLPAFPPLRSSRRASGRAPARPTGCGLCRMLPSASFCSLPLTSIQFGDLDLLRPGSFDPRPVALIDPSADANDTILEALETYPSTGKDALMSFQNRDRQRLSPAPPEIQLDRAPALADGEDLTFNDCEPTPLGKELCPIPSRQYHIARIGPEAKLCAPCHTLS